MERVFHLRRDGVSASKEILCGITTFLTMSYILFVNPSIAAEGGMPLAGAFAATALAAAACSLVMGLFANVPFAMAPGMSLNTLIMYSVCLGMGFHWKEGLALAFITGLLHTLIMASPLRKLLVNAIPGYLKMAAAAGMGLFIAYMGVKNAGFLSFTLPAGGYEVTATGAAVGGFLSIPGIAPGITAQQALAAGGLIIMVALLALGAKMRENYAALPVGVIAVTFVGIPLNITELSGISIVDISPLEELKDVFFSFFGDPGLLSLCENPARAATALLACLMLLLTNVVDSISSIIGIGSIPWAPVFEEADMEALYEKGLTGRLGKTLVCNSLGGGISALFGATPCTTYIESASGILSGGRSGLTACVTGLMFLCCLPLANFFRIVPSVASAPALIIAGGFMLPLILRIDWKNFEESCPAFMTLLFLPVSGSIVGGVLAGIITHVVVQAAVGKWRSVHPLLYGIVVLFIGILLGGGPNI